MKHFEAPLYLRMCPVNPNPDVKATDVKATEDKWDAGLLLRYHVESHSAYASENPCQPQTPLLKQCCAFAYGCNRK